MTMAKKKKPDRQLLTDYGDYIFQLHDEIKNGQKPSEIPHDMKNANREAAHRVASSIAENSADAKARRLFGDVDDCLKRSIKANSDPFTVIAMHHFSNKFRECYAAVGADGRDMDAVIGAIEAAFAIATLAPPNEGVLNELKRRGTKTAREVKEVKTRNREADIAKAFRDVSAEKKIPLKAGEKYIDIFFKNDVASTLGIAPDDLPSNRTLRKIVADIIRGNPQKK